MKKWFGLTTAALLTLCLTSLAGAATTTLSTGFEDLATGDYNSIVLPWVTFTNNMGVLRVTSSVPGPNLSGERTVIGPNTHSIAERNIATFSIPNVHAVSVAMGDFDVDEDKLYLEAYDSKNNLVASDYALLPANVYGGPTLSVSAIGSIAQVKFYSDGRFPGSFYFDNFQAKVVPEPTSLLLLGTGLLGLVGWKNNKTKKD